MCYLAKKGTHTMKKSIIKTLISIGASMAVAIPAVAIANTGCSPGTSTNYTFNDYIGTQQYLMTHAQQTPAANFDSTYNRDVRAFVHINGNLQFATNLLLTTILQYSNQPAPIPLSMIVTGNGLDVSPSPGPVFTATLKQSPSESLLTGSIIYNSGPAPTEVVAETQFSFDLKLDKDFILLDYVVATTGGGVTTSVHGYSDDTLGFDNISGIGRANGRNELVIKVITDSDQPVVPGIQEVDTYLNTQLSPYD
jgi:hypothetical protein